MARIWTYGTEISHFSYQPLGNFATVSVFSGAVRDMVRQTHSTIVRQAPRCLVPSQIKLDNLGWRSYAQKLIFKIWHNHGFHKLVSWATYVVSSYLEIISTFRSDHSNNNKTLIMSCIKFHLNWNYERKTWPQIIKIFMFTLKEFKCKYYGSERVNFSRGKQAKFDRKNPL